MYNKKWEYVGGISSRLKVPGGWIVRSTTISTIYHSVHTIFISDPNYEWKLEEDKEGT